MRSCSFRYFLMPFRPSLYNSSYPLQISLTRMLHLCEKWSQVCMILYLEGAGWDNISWCCGWITFIHLSLRWDYGRAVRQHWGEPSCLRHNPAASTSPILLTTLFNLTLKINLVLLGRMFQELCKCGETLIRFYIDNNNNNKVMLHWSCIRSQDSMVSLFTIIFKYHGCAKFYRFIHLCY